LREGRERGVLGDWIPELAAFAGIEGVEIAAAGDVCAGEVHVYICLVAVHVS
jgi:hypothetical protein